MNEIIIEIDAQNKPLEVELDINHGKVSLDLNDLNTSLLEVEEIEIEELALEVFEEEVEVIHEEVDVTEDNNEDFFELDDQDDLIEFDDKFFDDFDFTN